MFRPQSKKGKAIVTWFWLASAGICGVGIGLFFGFLGFRRAALLMRATVWRSNRDLAEAQAQWLFLLRRELANWLFRRDPDRYHRAYKTALEVTAAIRAASPAEQRSQHAKLAEQYPSYFDFDLIYTRQYVLYADALESYSYDDVERHYTDIIRFETLQGVLDENWPTTNAISDKELKHLEGYVRELKDTLFKGRLEAAIREFRAYQCAKSDGLLTGGYDFATFTIRPVEHFAEIRYGIHLKETDECGLYGFFVPDSGDQPITGFYRSNADFTAEIYLADTLSVDCPS